MINKIMKRIQIVQKPLEKKIVKIKDADKKIFADTKMWIFGVP